MEPLDVSLERAAVLFDIERCRGQRAERYIKTARSAFGAGGLLSPCGLEPTAYPHRRERFAVSVEEHATDISIFGPLNEILNRRGDRIEAFKHERGKDYLPGDNDDADKERKEKKRAEEAGNTEEGDGEAR